MPVIHDHSRIRALRRAFPLAVAILFLGALVCPAVAARDVRVAVTGLKPTLFIDDQGKPAGFFVDLVNDMASQEGWNVIWVPGTLSESWDRLNYGEIDLLPGVTDTPDREVLYNFSSEPALSVWSQVYARPGSGINTILDLEGKRVTMLRGAASGSGFREYARKFGVNATYIEKDTPAEVFSATASGEADALVVFNTQGLEDAKTYGLAATPVMFNPTQFGFAVRKGKNQDLLVAIDGYIAKGKENPSSVYSQAMQKWFSVKGNASVPLWLLWGLTAAVGLVALFLIMSLVLRRKVRRKTAELEIQNKELQSEVASRRRAEEELVRKNEELHAAYEQLTATGDELREKYQELHKSDQALKQARKKLNLLNTLTFQDIQNGIFSLSGYFQLAKQAGCSEPAQEFLGKGRGILHGVEDTLQFAKKYQDLGMNQPRWQNVNFVLLNAISHLDLSRITRTIGLGTLEIYADPLLEDVFFTIMENVVVHGEGVTRVSASFRQENESITILIADNGPGIPPEEKERIFLREHARKGGSGLFLAREILSVTGISLTETGEPGAGARFEITVPKGQYRFAAPS